MRLTQLAHQFLEAQLHKGDLAIDATAGNGHDTVKLAQLVGPEGCIIAIDIQAQAIAATQDHLKAIPFPPEYQLIQADHARILNQLIATYAHKANAITFNLGYLPGNNKKVHTQAETTLLALEASATLLAPSGLLLVTAYPGHPSGQKEARAVKEWMDQQKSWLIECHEPEVKSLRLPPMLWVAQKPEVSFSKMTLMQ